MLNLFSGKGKQVSLAHKESTMNPRTDDDDFPRDRQCRTLKEIRGKLKTLSGVSENDRKEAVDGINKALKLLRCDE